MIFAQAPAPFPGFNFSVSDNINLFTRGWQDLQRANYGWWIRGSHESDERHWRFSPPLSEKLVECNTTPGRAQCLTTSQHGNFLYPTHPSDYSPWSSSSQYWISFQLNRTLKTPSFVWRRYTDRTWQTSERYTFIKPVIMQIYIVPINLSCAKCETSSENSNHHMYRHPLESHTPTIMTTNPRKVIMCK